MGGPILNPPPSTSPARSAPRLTAVVLTLNEAAHLPDCLAHLAWADNVLVLDSGSTDGTVDIAQASGATVAVHPFTNYSRQRQHALGLVTTPWVLFVDADERVDEPLASEIRAALATADERDVAGFWIPRRNDFWGHRLKGGGWWPDPQLRLLDVRRARYDPSRAVHEVAELDGHTATLAHPFLHFNYADAAEFRAKQSDYANLEVERRFAAGLHVRPRQFILQPIREFYRRYVKLGGWRDGWLGVTLCAWMAVTEFRTLWRLGARWRSAA